MLPQSSRKVFPKKRRRCGCKGSTGHLKELYETAEEAESVAKRRGWRRFRVYRCPKKRYCGWHVTHEREEHYGSPEDFGYAGVTREW